PLSVKSMRSMKAMQALQPQVNALRNKYKSDPQRLFFFQAEDGIRDRNVTGVQTCALPISKFLNLGMPLAEVARAVTASPAKAIRSEERRVGKEWRSRGLLYPLKVNSMRWMKGMKSLEPYVNSLCYKDKSDPKRLQTVTLEI